jgi:hypothetical protein
MIETMKKEDLVRMLVTLWAIWHAKRKAIHEDVFQIPMATIAFVNRFIEDLNGCTEPVKKKGGRIQTIEKKKGWIAPPAGRTKVNVDAAVSKSVPKGAVGVVCQSPEGVFLGASAMVFDGINHRVVLKLWHAGRHSTQLRT